MLIWPLSSRLPGWCFNVEVFLLDEHEISGFSRSKSKWISHRHGYVLELVDGRSEFSLADGSHPFEPGLVMTRSILWLILLFVAALSLSVVVDPQIQRENHRYSGNAIEILLGEGRRMFANHFAVKADVYLHSGFYPSIFDQAAVAEQKEKLENEVGEEHKHTEDCEHAEHAGHAHGHAGKRLPEGHKCDTTFMGQPRDWIERFGRNFVVTEHAHLEDGKAAQCSGEMLQLA